MNMSIRELLGVSVKTESRGLPQGVRVAGFVAYLVLIAGLTWAGSALLGTPGAVVGAVLGVVVGTLTSMAIFRSYRGSHTASPE